MLRHFLHPQFNVFEELYRVLPDDSWFDPSVSSNSPIQFELGAYKVPQAQHLWLTDYEFSVYRMSGQDPGDIVLAEPGRFSAVMGFDITINGRRMSHLLYQLDPHPVSIQRQSFETQGTASGPSPQNQAFVRSQYNSFAAATSAALSLLPVRRQVQGAAGAPFTFIAKQGDVVSLSCVIFKRVMVPIAAIQGRHAGFLMQGNLSEALIERLSPR